MKPDSLEEFRYELKFVDERAGPAAVRRLVARHPALFTTAYPSRQVNGLYLDSPMRSAYLDNVEGNPRRTKARVRWYGPLLGHIEKPILEIKAKRGMVGGKHRYPLPPFDLDPSSCWLSLAPMLCGPSVLDEEGRAAVDGLEGVCTVSYQRDYYLSADGRYRLTVDADVTAIAIGRPRPRWHHRVEEPERVVVELKYEPGDDDDAHRISAWFPFRQARNSKYARALEALAL